MLKIGPHLSTGPGIDNLPKVATASGYTAFALFTKSPREWRAAPLPQHVTEGFKANLVEAGIKPEDVIPHSSFLLNAAAPTDYARRQTCDSLTEELDRLEKLGLLWLNMHPGSTKDKEKMPLGIQWVATTVTAALKRVITAGVLLECTAGGGATIGSQLEELAGIINLIPDNYKNRVGVCIDTCHAFSAGYPVHTAQGVQDFLTHFETLLPLSYLKAIHLNDSMTPMGSRKDRHALLGKGSLGVEGIKAWVTNPTIKDLPLILETPDPSGWPAEVAWVRTL